MSIYGYTKDLFRNVLPLELRQKIWSSNNPLTNILSSLKKLLLTTAKHDDLYDDEYYRLVVEGPMLQSALIIANSIKREFSPMTLIDVGCGTGVLLMELKKQDVQVMGLEYSTSALKYCQARGLNVVKFDLESDETVTTGMVDVCVSTEVAEHLPSTSAEKYVDLLTQISSTVVMTAAPPGQGGTDHVNEQPNEYWVEKFHHRKFYFDHALTLKFRQEWKKENVVSWYYENVMVFKKID